MDATLLIDGLVMYLGLVIMLTCHEFGHAWMALKCGDDTAQREGRVSLNPLVHIDLLGTVILPLVMIFLSLKGSGLAGFLLGWAKPVPVNPSNLRRPRTDDILVTLAGPWMNLLLGVLLIGLARLAGQWDGVAGPLLGMAHLSLLLCFFNLLPIPPLDGSQVVRAVTGMTYETYHEFARYGFFILIILLQVPAVQILLSGVTGMTYAAIGRFFGLEVG